MHRIAVAQFAVLLLATPALARGSERVAEDVSVVSSLPDGKVPDEPEIRLAPVFSDERSAHDPKAVAHGFRVVEMKPGTSLAAIGVREGDVITGVNGKPLETSRDVFFAWNDLRHGVRGVLDLTRDGKPQTFAYDVP